MAEDWDKDRPTQMGRGVGADILRQKYLAHDKLVVTVIRPVTPAVRRGSALSQRGHSVHARQIQHETPHLTTKLHL